jgi:hypothetical protein
MQVAHLGEVWKGPRAGAAAWDQEVGDAQKVKWLDQNWPIGPEEEW